MKVILNQRILFFKSINNIQVYILVIYYININYNLGDILSFKYHFNHKYSVPEFNRYDISLVILKDIITTVNNIMLA